jgi:hypothetical protein
MGSTPQSRTMAERMQDEDRTIKEKMYWWDMFIEIRTIHDLLRLSEKFGEIIINAKEKSIEIYDDYRE